MTKTNGKGEPEQPDIDLDLDHELPAAEEGEAPVTQAAEVAVLQAEQQKLQGEMARLKAERDTLLDRLARLQAEFDNYRKRAAREQNDFREYALAEAIKSLLPVVDSFDRALTTEQRGDEFHAGIELINRQLHDALNKLGVQSIPALGEHFDPNIHEAVQVVETTEVEDEHVLDELQRGYRLKERLLRPAMVRVARKPGA
jgi:molecular chaperone GrpE